MEVSGGKKLPASILDDQEEVKKIDSDNMLSFCVGAAEHYQKARILAEKISLPFKMPKNLIIAGMGGSGIGGEILKDLARNKASVPIEVNRDYSLPAFANENSLVLLLSYSGETEETLSAFLDATKRKCKIFCVSSGGSLLDFSKKMNIPFLPIPQGMPPRAALPYLLAPLLFVAQEMNIIEPISEDFTEAIKLLSKISQENSVEKSSKENFCKKLALEINNTVPVVYGFSIYRSVAQRLKQQFNENSKVPSKWEFFSELNHNEIVGWENADEIAKYFSVIFIRDRNEPREIRTRIETTKSLLPLSSKTFEVWAQGRSELAKILSTICIGDFTSVYLAILRKVDPTPVSTITQLKERIEQTGKKRKIIHELRKIAEK